MSVWLSELAVVGFSVLVGRGRGVGALVGSGVGVGGNVMGRAGAGLALIGTLPLEARGFGPGEAFWPRCEDGLGAPVGAGLEMPAADFCGCGLAATAFGADVAGALVGAAVAAGGALMTGLAVTCTAGAGDGFAVGAAVAGAIVGGAVA